MQQTTTETVEEKIVDPNTLAPVLDEHKEHPDLKEEVKDFVQGAGLRTKEKVAGFLDFIREQGVIGLAIGFLLGGAVSKTVSSFVDNVVNPLIGLGLGKVNLSDKVFTVGEATLRYGAFISSLIDFVIIAAVIYFIFRGLKVDHLDKKKQ